MMSFVEYQDVDLVHPNERMQQTLMEYLRGTHNDHILGEMCFPGFMVPQVSLHGATELVNLLVNVVLEYSSLLEDKCNTINLLESQFRGL